MLLSGRGSCRGASGACVRRASALARLVADPPRRSGSFRVVPGRSARFRRRRAPPFSLRPRKLRRRCGELSTKPCARHRARARIRAGRLAHVVRRESGSLGRSVGRAPWAAPQRGSRSRPSLRLVTARGVPFGWSPGGATCVPPNDRGSIGIRVRRDVAAMSQASRSTAAVRGAVRALDHARQIASLSLPRPRARPVQSLIACDSTHAGLRTRASPPRRCVEAPRGEPLRLLAGPSPDARASSGRRRRAAARGGRPRRAVGSAARPLPGADRPFGRVVLDARAHAWRDVGPLRSARGSSQAAHERGARLAGFGGPRPQAPCGLEPAARRRAQARATCARRIASTSDRARPMAR